MKRNLSPLDYSEFYRGVVELHGDRCWACRSDTANRWKCVDRSRGILDAHHVIPQRVIKRNVDPELVTQALCDSRNGVMLARWHHDQVEAAMTRILIPHQVMEFASDYGLMWWLENLADRQAA